MTPIQMARLVHAGRFRLVPIAERARERESRQALYREALKRFEGAPDGARRIAGIRAARLDGSLWFERVVSLLFRPEDGGLSTTWPSSCASPWRGRAMPENGLDVLVASVRIKRIQYEWENIDSVRLSDGAWVQVPLYLGGHTIDAIALPEIPPQLNHAYIDFQIVPAQT